MKFLDYNLEHFNLLVNFNISMQLITDLHALTIRKIHNECKFISCRVKIFKFTVFGSTLD